MKIELTIPDDLIEKIVRGIMDNYPEAGHGCSLRCVDWRYEAMTFEFEDCEDGKLYMLDKAKLLAAFPLLFSDKWPKGCTKPPMSDDWEVWSDWLCQADAQDFDAFVQLVVFGEVIYG
jgi:hypothetical protein